MAGTFKPCFVVLKYYYFYFEITCLLNPAVLKNDPLKSTFWGHQRLWKYFLSIYLCLSLEKIFFLLVLMILAKIDVKFSNLFLYCSLNFLFGVLNSPCALQKSSFGIVHPKSMPQNQSIYSSCTPYIEILNLNPVLFHWHSLITSHKKKKCLTLKSENA